MARLVAVCRSDDYPFERRQIPLVVDDNLTMVLQFSDSCTGCESTTIKQKELERFVKKYKALSTDELSLALMATSKEIFNVLTQLLPCVGCRRSVERLFNQLVDSGHPALEPLVISRSSYLTVKQEYLQDPKQLFKLFHSLGPNLSHVIEAIPKSKKNKRCVLHSLDTHKTKTLGIWIETWEALSKECREEVILIDCDDLVDTLENYLRKHRFCSECKSKVLRAYHILVGELESTSEKGYCPALYDGLRCCPGERHIHVSCQKDYVSQLISRAEPELSGTNRRERHAKTLDIAQEEVLTCLGIYLYDRLHKIWQKLRAEEQTWQVLYHFSVDSLRKSFEMAVERKQGISNLELICKELLEEEQAKEQRREQKRQKRKKKKVSNIKAQDEVEECLCAELSIKCKNCSLCEQDQNSNTIISRSSEEKCSCGSSSISSAPCHRNGLGREAGGLAGNRSDCGYSSGHEGCDSCHSLPSSQDGSDVACSEGICNHDGDSLLCHRDDVAEGFCDCSRSPHSNGRNSQLNKERNSPENGRCTENGCANSQWNDTSGSGTGKYNMSLTLQDMLEASCSSGEEDDFISEEEIRMFKANAPLLNTKRQQLRETLKQRFATMQRTGCSLTCKGCQGKGSSHLLNGIQPYRCDGVCINDVALVHHSAKLSE